MAFGLFKKKKKEAPKKTQDKYLQLTIKDVVRETENAVSIVFDTDNSTLTYEPGQFITLIENINGKKIRRAYSLCTSPFTDSFPAVTVKRVAGGAMSNHVNDTLLPGSKIEIMEAMGQFTTDYSADRKRHVVLFGGGSGITPLMSLTKSILYKEPQSKVSLVYANEDEANIIFKKGLEELEGQYQGRFSVVHVLNNPPANWHGHKGWLTKEKIEAILEELSAQGGHIEYFTCGPGPMMDIVVETLKSQGINEDKIRLESFEAGKTSPKEIIDAGEEGPTAHPVKIILDGEEYSFEVPADKTILEQGLDQDIDMPYSCQSGLCTACRGKLLSGSVKMTQYDGLSEEEYDEGYVLCCQAHPETDDVAIEIG